MTPLVPTPMPFAGAAGRLVARTVHDDARDARLPVLFLHPINLSGRAWSDVASLLEPPRCSFLPDLRGHGESAAAGPFGVDAWVADALATLDHFAVARAHVVGGSLGGAIAAMLAARHPTRVASVAAFGSTLRVEGADLASLATTVRARGPAAAFREVLPALAVAPGTPADVVEHILTLANPNDTETVLAIWKAAVATDVRDEATRVRCPVLVVSGALDRTCPPAQGRAMAELLHATYRELPAVGHLPMLEAPATTAALLSDHCAATERA